MFRIAGAVFVIATLTVDQSARSRSTSEMEVRTIKVNDVELAYLEEGTGDTVVLVHGFVGDWRSWDVLRPFISEKYHYVSLSRRCHYPNRCGDDASAYSQKQHAEDLAAFIRALNVGKVHLVGNSGGGRIAGYVALKYPELVRSVVMGEPGIIASDSPEAKAARLAAQENSAKVVAAMKAGDAEKAMRLHYDAIAGEQGAWDRLPVERQRQRLDNARTVIPTFTGRDISVTCEELGTLGVPALVVGGEKSPAALRYGNEALLRCVPKTTVSAMVPGAHHEWYAVNPEASAKTILAFVDNVRESSQDRATTAPALKRVSIDGATITYLEQGTGIPVVFVHGAISDHRIWEPQREPVAKRYRFIAIDQRYFGGAAWSDTGARFSPTTHVSDLAAFIRALDAGPVYVVGRSYGASIALATAVQHPHLVRGLLLNEPQVTSILNDSSDQKIAAEFRQGLAAVRAAADAGRADEATRLFYEWVDDRPAGFDALPTDVRAMFLENARTVALQLNAPPPPPTCPQAGQLNVPVIITKGELTRPFFRVIAEAASRCIPGSKLVTIEGARHGAPMQQPAAFNELLLAFLAGGVKTVEVNGTDLAYVEEGQGETVVFVHGALGDWRTWEDLRPFISQKYHYVSLSRRYHYPNPWADDGRRYSQEQHVEDLAAFIRALDVGKVHLVGNSGGGRLAGHVALRYPELVRSVVLGEPAGLLPPAGEPQSPAAGAQPKWQAAIKAGDLRAAVRLFLDNAVGEGVFERLPPERQQRYLDNARTLALGAAPVPVTCEQVSALKVPALLVRGEISSWQEHERFLRCLPKTTEFAIIPGAHHGWHIANAEASAKAVLAFLSKQRTTSAGQGNQPRGTQELQVKKLKVNDVEVAYVEEGKGETVVFVHGGGVGDWRSWERLRPFISAKAHYVALSRRYHYPNPWIDDGRNYTMAQHVEDVAAFIRALNVGKVHLVGNSYGGGIVARVALKYPELLRRVIFGEGLLAPVSAEGKAAMAAAQKDNARLREAVESGDLRQAATLQYDRSVGEGAFEKLPPERQQQLLYDVKTLRLEQRSAEATAPLTCEQVGRLSVPALLIRGEKTMPPQRYRFEMTAGCLPKTAATAIIPGAPHSWHAINPEDSAKAILTFVAQHADFGSRKEMP